MAKIRQIFPDLPSFGSNIDKQVEIDAHYLGYLSRQKRDIVAFNKDEAISIPAIFNYDNLSGLSNEIKYKLNKIISIFP